MWFIKSMGYVAVSLLLSLVLYLVWNGDMHKDLGLVALKWGTCFDISFILCNIIISAKALGSLYELEGK